MASNTSENDKSSTISDRYCQQQVWYTLRHVVQNLLVDLRSTRRTWAWSTTDSTLWSHGLIPSSALRGYIRAIFQSCVKTGSVTPR
jgi:hypothetical protein